jgi:hypothetical protein
VLIAVLAATQCCFSQTSRQKAPEQQAPAIDTPYSTRPPKEDITTWLNDALLRSVDEGGTKSWDENGAEFHKTNYSLSLTTTVTVTDCQISFVQHGTRMETHPKDENGIVRTAEDAYTITATLNLQDIALDKIRSIESNTVGSFRDQPQRRPPYTAVSLSTTGKKAHYTFNISPHVEKMNGSVIATDNGLVLGKTGDENDIVIPLKTADMAPRLIKAFYDLSLSCGAKEVNNHLY